MSIQMPSIPEEQAVQCVGKGWEPLIRRLYAAMPEGAYVVQVKEKFGGLRFYYYNGTEEFRKLVDEAERESYTTCEWCGQPGSEDARNGWWILTLCEDCKVKRTAKRSGA